MFDQSEHAQGPIFIIKHSNTRFSILTRIDIEFLENVRDFIAVGAGDFKKKFKKLVNCEQILVQNFYTYSIPRTLSGIRLKSA